jgi:hypothetical protein
VKPQPYAVAREERAGAAQSLQHIDTKVGQDLLGGQFARQSSIFTESIVLLSASSTSTQAGEDLQKPM